MGVAAFDADNDLDIDLYWTAWPQVSNAMYENRGGLEFENTGLASGTDDPRGWGISVNAGDVDLDGWQDFFVTNGFDNSSAPNVLFLNDRDGSFSDITATIGGGDFDGRGVAFADFDNDGDLDLVVTADAGRATRLWRNDSAHREPLARSAAQGYRIQRQRDRRSGSRENGGRSDGSGGERRRR